MDYTTGSLAKTQLHLHKQSRKFTQFYHLGVNCMMNLLFKETVVLSSINGYTLTASHWKPQPTHSQRAATFLVSRDTPTWLMDTHSKKLFIEQLILLDCYWDANIHIWSTQLKYDTIAVPRMTVNDSIQLFWGYPTFKALQNVPMYAEPCMIPVDSL